MQSSEALSMTASGVFAGGTSNETGVVYPFSAIMRRSVTLFVELGSILDLCREKESAMDIAMLY